MQTDTQTNKRWCIFEKQEQGGLPAQNYAARICLIRRVKLSSTKEYNYMKIKRKLKKFSTVKGPSKINISTKIKTEVLERKNVF